MGGIAIFVLKRKWSRRSRVMAMFAPTDEARHQPTGAPWWEGHRLITVADDSLSAIAMQVLVKTSASHNSASFHCGLFRSGRPPIVIAEADIRAPESRWEFRTSGLWADTICETPFEHWTYGLEAFGLEITDPAELLGRGYGDRVPLGWELDFEAEPGVASPTAIAAPAEPLTGYSQRGLAHGLVLSIAGEEEFAGAAIRQHWWGSAATEDIGPGLGALDEQINSALNGASDAAFDGASGAAAGEVALPIVAGDGTAAVQWWLTWFGSGLRSHTVM